MMRRQTAVLGRKAEGKRNVELCQSVHLAVEPGFGVRTKAIGPTQTRAQMADPELV